MQLFIWNAFYIRMHCNSIDLRNIYLEQMDEFTHRAFKKKIYKKRNKNCLTDIQSFVV